MYATWNDAALEHAKRAYLEWTVHAWSIAPIACGEALCIVNNAMSQDSLLTRERQLSEFQAELRALGVKELAYAECPESDSDGLHSYALVLDASEKQLPLISKVYEGIVKSSGGNFCT